MTKDAVEDVIEYCRDKNRVCPMPQQWSKLWKMLPNRRRDDDGWQPPSPLILAAWHVTPNMMKMLRLVEHIQWAEKHGALESAATFLHKLNEEDWHHLGD